MNLTKVRLTKINGKPDSSHHVGISLEGYETNAPEIGQPYGIDAMDGDNGRLKVTSVHGYKYDYFWFHTTPLAEIDGDLLITQNSTWKREVL